MLCPNCGTRNEPGAQFCRSCGVGLTPGARQAHAASPNDTGEVGWLGVLFFCIPLAGAVMYFVWKDDKPRNAKRACNLALFGFFFGLALQILVGVLQVLTAH